MNFKLIPITGKNVIEKWGFFIEGMEKVDRYSKNDENLTIVYNDILNGNALLWSGFMDKKYIGFIVTQILQSPLEEKRMLIRAMFANEKLSDEIYEEGFMILDNYARSMGIKKMEFYTPRDKAFERKLKDNKWQSKYVIFEREVI